MDEHRFDTLTRIVAGPGNRRDVLCGLAVAGLAASFAWLPNEAAARKKRRKPKKARPNAFGCLDVGDPCRNAGQCCSGICAGKKGKRRCAARNAGLCGPGRDVCTAGVDTTCAGSGDERAICWLTTGKAGYCGSTQAAVCRDCARDVDCQEEFGPEAACLDVRGGTCGALGLCADTGGVACIPAFV